MEPSALQYAILRLLELQATRGNPTYVEEAVIAAVTGGLLDEVHKQLEILDHQQLVERVIVSPTSWAAAVTYHKPRLRLIAGSLRCCHRASHPATATGRNNLNGVKHNKPSEIAFIGVRCLASIDTCGCD